MMSSGINLVMTVIGFAVSILFIVFVCTRLICARIQMSAARRSIRGATRSDLSVLERGLHGVEHVILSNFPTKKYSDGFFSSAETIQCTVCLADYNKEDTLRILPACGHFFHASCIDAWLYQHSTCPVCRISLREVTEKNVLCNLCSVQPLEEVHNRLTQIPMASPQMAIGFHSRHLTTTGRHQPVVSVFILRGQSRRWRKPDYL